MPITVDRDEVLRLLEDSDAQIVEVLPRWQYDDEHIEGALHLPLEQLHEHAADVLDRGRPVIFYCWNDL